MSKPDWGTADIECANARCKWIGRETDLVPDPNPKVAPRGRMTAIENVCPACFKAGYYFVEDEQ